MKHHGIEITKVLDEEFCYIPMGGALPKLNQVRTAVRWLVSMTTVVSCAAVRRRRLLFCLERKRLLSAEGGGRIMCLVAFVLC